MIGLLLISAGIAIHVEDARGLEPSEPIALADALGRAIFARTATAPRIDDPVWGECAEADRCVAAIRARTGASAVVMLRAFAAGAKMRVTLELAGSGLEPLRLDLSREPVSWSEPMRGAAARLFAEGHAQAELELARAGPPLPRIGPYALGAVGAAMLGVGIALGASSAADFEEVDRGVARASAVDGVASSASAQAVVANLMFAGAALAIGGALAWWWSQD